MKTWLSIKRALLFLPTAYLMAAEIPYILEVKKDTPLFSRPSMQGERLAEAEAGTLLLFVEKSRKNIWVKLRDSDGLEGWMPLERTDYKEVSAAHASSEQIQQISNFERAAKPTPQKSREEMMEDILRQQKEKETAFNPFLRVAPLMRWLSDSEPASTRLGARVDYSLGSINGNGALSPAWASAEFTLPAPQTAHSSDLSAALRYVWRAPLWGPLIYGPDLGYSLDKVRSDYRHHFAVGLAAGLGVGPFDLMLRGGYDLFSHSRASVDVQVGVSF